MAVRGRIQLVGIRDNFFNVYPPPLPMSKGWGFDVNYKTVGRIAEIYLDDKNRMGNINLDARIFNDPELPDGCKVFMFFHELGHPIYKEREELCDEFAFWHALRAGVTPFLCFVALAAFMPKHYTYRVERLKKIMLQNPQLKEYTDAG